MNSLTRAHRYTHEKEEDKNPIATLVGYIIAPFLGGWIFVWYNYVWIQYPIGYWSLVALSIPILFIPKWLKHPAFGILFAGAAIGQTLSWLGYVLLPFIKL